MDVADWLRRLGLERYDAAFRENDVGPEILLKLTADDLRELGVASVGHRRKLLDAIEVLHSEAAAVGSARAGSSSGPESTAERRQLSVMFCDIIGFTTLSSRLDPEDLSAVIRGYQERVATTISRCGGFIARYVGDGVLIYFGWPEAHEANAEKAVRAALAVADAVSQTPVRSEALQIRIGIATGLVVVGEPIGAGDARQQTAIGETPNLAARLQGLAPPDGIVIDAVTRHQIGGLFECRDLGLVALKGLPEPVPAWQVLGDAAAESRFEALHPGSMTPLIGRDEELELLQRRWQQAKQGEGQLVLLSGEPGIGKSRLIAAVEERFSDESHETLRYFCSPHHQDSALYPVVTRWEQDLRFTRGETSREKLAKLEAAFTSLATSLMDVTLIADLLSVPVDERYPKLDLSPQRKKDETFETLLRGLSSRARRQPVLMLFEDAHWADASSLELLDKVVSLLADTSILLIISFRPEFQPPWVGLAFASSITLRRLTNKQATQLAERVVVEEILPPTLLERIVAQTDGVPLFIEELTKAVLEKTAQPGGNREVLDIPATLHASLIARLDRLPAARLVIQIGAVIGREFSHSLLAAVAHIPDAQLTHDIEMLVASGLAFRRGVPPQAVYTFKHALVRDAAYSTLLRARRQQLHALIGHALERSFRETVEAEPEVLAHHFTQAGLTEKAIVYWHQAGERALRRSANAEASAHLRRAIELVGILRAGEDRDRTELTLQTALGTATRALTGHASDESLGVYLRARKLLNPSVPITDQMSVLYGLWSVNIVRCEHLASRDVAQQSMTLVALTRDPEALAFAHRMMGFTLWVAGESADAAPLFERVIALYKPGQSNVTDLRYSQDHAVWALSTLALSLWHLGFPDRAAEASSRSLSWADRIGHSMTTGFALSFGSILNGLLVADPERDYALSEKVLSYCSQHDLKAYLPWATFYRGLALARNGQPIQGIGLMREGMANAEQIRMKMAWSIHLGHLAFVHALLGELDAALNTMEQALLAVADTGERAFEAELYRMKAMLLLKSCRAEEAEEALNDGIVIARRQRARMWELRIATMLARIRAHQGQPESARSLLQPVVAWFREGFESPDLREAGALLHTLS